MCVCVCVYENAHENEERNDEHQTNGQTELTEHSVSVFALERLLRLPAALRSADPNRRAIDNASAEREESMDGCKLSKLTLKNAGNAEHDCPCEAGSPTG